METEGDSLTPPGLDFDRRLPGAWADSDTADTVSELDTGDRILIPRHTGLAITRLMEY